MVLGFGEAHDSQPLNYPSFPFSSQGTCCNVTREGPYTRLVQGANTQQEMAPGRVRIGVDDRNPTAAT